MMMKHSAKLGGRQGELQVTHLLEGLPCAFHPYPPHKATKVAYVSCTAGMQPILLPFLTLPLLSRPGVLPTALSLVLPAAWNLIWETVTSVADVGLIAMSLTFQVPLDSVLTVIVPCLGPPAWTLQPVQLLCVHRWLLEPRGYHQVRQNHMDQSIAIGEAVLYNRNALSIQ